MRDNKRQNLSVNERKIVELTLQGESQIDIANKLDVAPSTVYRTIKKRTYPRYDYISHTRIDVFFSSEDVAKL